MGPKPQKEHVDAVRSALSQADPAMQAVFKKHPEMKAELQRSFMQRLADADGKADARRIAGSLPGMMQALSKHWQEDPLSLRIYIAQTGALQRAAAVQQAVRSGK